MAQDFEINHTEATEQGEISAEAVRQLAKQMQSGGGQFCQTEEHIRKLNASTAYVMVKMLKSPGKGTLAKLMAKAIHEGTPPALVLGVASLVCYELNPEMPRVEVLIFQGSTWPGEHRERLQDWEKIVVASLQYCVDKFREIAERNSGVLPNLAKLIEYVLKKTCNIEGFAGQKMVDALIALINSK